MDGDRDGLEVELRCLDCGAIGAFSFERATVDPNPVDPAWDGICFSRPARCQRCGAEDHYKLVRPSAAELRARAIQVPDARAFELSREPLIYAHLTIWDGTVIRRPTQAIGRLREIACARPTNGEAWRRLGNCCAQFGLYDEAETALRHALDVDAEELHAAVELAALLSEIGREDFAAPVQEALARWGKAHAKPDDLPELADRLTRVVKRLALATDEEGSLEMAWAGESSGAKQVVHVSKVDLQKIDRWDRLADLFASGKVFGARLVRGIPEEVPTQLQVLLDSEAEDAEAELMTMSPTLAPAWRSSSKKRNKRGKTK